MLTKDEQKHTHYWQHVKFLHKIISPACRGIMFKFSCQDIRCGVLLLFLNGHNHWLECNRDCSKIVIICNMSYFQSSSSINSSTFCFCLFFYHYNIILFYYFQDVDFPYFPRHLCFRLL